MIDAVFRRTDRYRLVDVGSKLAGVALLCGALEYGIVSTLGLVLAMAGIAVGVSTVFVSEDSL